MKKILVIEDETPLRSSIIDLLEMQGFQAYAAENGMEGLQIAERELPDLILCDIMMPGMDGYRVVGRLRKNSLTAAIPFIFLTARADRSDFRQGMALGADDYLTKPFEPDELFQVIETRLQRHEFRLKKAQSI